MSDLFGQNLVPVISLWQPWASLIFTGHKLHETRAYPFPAKYAGQRVAIHAAKALPREIPVPLHLLCEANWGALSSWRYAVPRGAIIGTVTLLQAFRTEDIQPGTVDRVCGDWTPGRFAWLLDLPARLPAALPAKGKQGWWSVEAALLRS